MAGGQRSFILFIILAVVAACGRTPLEDQLPNPQPKQSTGPINHGSIKVTLYTNSLANGNGQVDLLLPDGSKRSQGASPSCVFSGLTQAGIYTARYQNQPSAAPAGVTVTLSAASPTANVSLQIGPASLVLTPATAQPLGFGFDPTTFYYNVQFTQSSDQAQDVVLDLDPSSLPPGWTYAFFPALMRGNGGGTLAVTSALACTSTSIALSARATVAGVPAASAPILVTRAWSLGLSANWSASTYFTGVSGGYDDNESFWVTVQATGVASGSGISVECLDCPTSICVVENGAPTYIAKGSYLNYPAEFLLPANSPTLLMLHVNTNNVFTVHFQLNLGSYSLPVQFTSHP